MKKSVLFGFAGLLVASALSAQSTSHVMGDDHWVPPMQAGTVEYARPVMAMATLPEAASVWQGDHFRFSDKQSRTPVYLRMAAEVLTVASGHQNALKCVTGARKALPTRTPVPRAAELAGCN